MVDFIHVGLDVHARSVQGCGISGETGEVFERRLDNDPDQVAMWLLGLPGVPNVVYEAGPTGFELARVLIEYGLKCAVLAPSKIPTFGDRIKTDKRDARRLSEVAASPRLSDVSIWIPDRDTEAARDVYRAREDAMLSCRAGAQRLTHFLLRHQRRWEGGSTWTKAHLGWLTSQRFTDPCVQASFDYYLGAVLDLRRHLHDADALVTEYAGTARWVGVVNAFQCLRGISTLSAYGFAVEIGDFTRLTPQTIGAYLGLVPSEYSSGQSRHQGGITKTGNAHARRILVEAAWEHHKPYRPTQSVKLQRAWGNVDAPIRACSHQANQRLFRRWVSFDQRGKRSVKAVVAIARELAGFCHDLAIMTT